MVTTSDWQEGTTYKMKFFLLFGSPVRCATDDKIHRADMVGVGAEEQAESDPESLVGQDITTYCRRQGRIIASRSSGRSHLCHRCENVAYWRSLAREVKGEEDAPQSE